MPEDALVEFEHVRRVFGAPRARRAATVAVDDVSLRIQAGESVGIVGDSGAGKSTLAWLAAGLLRPTAGTIRVAGAVISSGSSRDIRTARRNVGLVFQDALGSFNPLRTVEHALTTPLEHFTDQRGDEARRTVGALMERVGLRPNQMTRYPHEFSGGQIQRLAIARALIARPRVVILDEPVSALDVSIRAQILNLLRELATDFKLTYLLIATDPAVVEHMTDRTAVMFGGRLLEIGPRDGLLREPRHPYTVSLLSLADVEGRLSGRSGLLASRAGTTNADGGCVFAGLCPLEVAPCRTVRPELVPAGPDHLVTCHAYAEGVERKERDLAQAGVGG